MTRVQDPRFPNDPRRQIETVQGDNRNERGDPITVLDRTYVPGSVKRSYFFCDRLHRESGPATMYVQCEVYRTRGMTARIQTDIQAIWYNIDAPKDPEASLMAWRGLGLPFRTDRRTAIEHSWRPGRQGTQFEYLSSWTFNNNITISRRKTFDIRDGQTDTRVEWSMNSLGGGADHLIENIQGFGLTPEDLFFNRTNRLEFLEPKEPNFSIT